MKKLLISILSVLCVCSWAETAPVEFTSLSVQILPASAQDGIGFDWTLEMSSVGDPDSINHELMLATQEHGFSHEGFFIFENAFEFEKFAVPFVLDIPPYADVDEDGMGDFFDASLSVDSVTTQGRHPDGNNRPVSFTATWTRAAGDSFGTVVIDLESLGLTFQHTFQLLRYVGEFSFQRTTNLLEGSLSITNVLEPLDITRGPLSVRVLNTNTLSYSALNWTNMNAATYTIVTNIEDGVARTNFVSYWLLEDGYPPTGELDYLDWIMILSSADSNNNGRLDLTEGTATPTERPRLGLVRLPNGSLEMTIQGTPGQTYTLESADAITGAAWQTFQTINLTSATQTITVSGVGSRRFFRLRQ